MEADVLAFAQQVCTGAYVDGQIASAEASLWGCQLTAAISGAIAVMSIVAFLISYVFYLKGRETEIAMLVSGLLAGVAAFVSLMALLGAGGFYGDMLSWQNDPVTQVVKDIAVAI